MILEQHFGNDAGTHGAAAFTNGEADAGLHGDRGDELYRHGDFVPGHDHLDSLG